MARIVALALGGALILAGIAPGRAAQPIAQPSLAPAVTVTRAVQREVVERAVVTGTLIPRQEVLVAPELEGLRITEVLVEEGDDVAQGQVLARLSRDLLDTTLAQNAATIARTEAAIAQAQSQIIQTEAAQVEAGQALERTRALMKSGNSTEVQLEQRVSAARAAEGRLAAARDGLRMAEAEKRSAEAQRREIEVKLARTEIRAPQAGIVSRKTARIGGTASAAGEPLFRIIANGEIELEGEVTETQLVRIREGAPAQVRVEPTASSTAGCAMSPRRWTVRRASAACASHCRATPSCGSARSRAGDVELARRTGIAVPVSSVIYAANGATVQMVVNDRVETRHVRTGLSAEGFVQIEEGVADGETMVTRAGSFLRDGDVVRPVVGPTAQAEGVR